MTSDAISALGRHQKKAIIILYDAAAMIVSLWLAFSIRLGHFHWAARDSVLLLCAGTVILGLVALHGLRIYRIVIRYFDVYSARRLLVGAGAATAMWFMLAFVSRIENLPRSVGFIYFGLLFLLMFFGRLAASQHLTASQPGSMVLDRRKGGDRRKIGVAIQGANAAGSALAETIRRLPQYELRFFVDDNEALIDRMMLGYPIRSSDDLREAVQSGRIKQVFLAMDNSTRTERLAALSSLSGMAVKVLTIPSHEEIMSGRYTISDVRPVNVEDLLKRDIVPAMMPSIERGIKGNSILITGAGGSIGSEICRQVLEQEPRRMVLLDHSEFALFAIQSELDQLNAQQPKAQRTEICPVIGSLLDERLIDGLLGHHEIDTVFHAAAYKHVPLLEDNEVIGVRNNVIGTRTLADACVKARVRRLTMISTDKAVRPTNVMGSSKRLAELYIQALAQQPNMPTRFGIVRFGNVLDSSGSVVQRFRQQIEEGGPITVTHPDITRFFMSIPEATQLVLQANSWATAGEVFVLDMGEPVKIAELARTMISLSGMTERNQENPDGDIEIAYVGLRPGEKLHEELFIGEAVGDTLHPQIKMAHERWVPMAELQNVMARLNAALAGHDAGAVRSILSETLREDHRMVA
ncbi:polysaccharide biosynthesis protein [Sphingosinicella rhizophila]|uniref:Nucleoside-diphosphate sugar epimerase/dehydratase n=1 Tax=Sphingosinicella rhizophila TaxID=3050082 RepID=A0ABU3Q722_9SPHN|nr:nucleoside-diphosphate sugar epimerase/dehydratase [Sphingosinicella sp. GR2756]MDT9598909.1 nucleoside-diphosphate sugar epimerase/dehydratase [Sphingosinicella sp. GR2756]